MVNLQRYEFSQEARYIHEHPTGTYVKWAHVEPLLKELEGLRRELEHVHAALNSGDGTYRP